MDNAASNDSQKNDKIFVKVCYSKSRDLTTEEQNLAIAHRRRITVAFPNTNFWIYRNDI